MASTESPIAATDDDGDSPNQTESPITSASDDGDSPNQSPITAADDDGDSPNQTESPITAAADDDGDSSSQPASPFRALSHWHYSADFEVKELLGKGGFGKVFRCVGLLDGMTYAVKQIQFDREVEYEKVVREVKTLSLLSHPNVVRYYQSWIEDSIRDLGFDSPTEDETSHSGDDERCTMYLVMEFCPQTLEQRIKDGLDNTSAWQFYEQLLAALAYLHDKGIIHRDISRSNLFVDSSGNIKLGDFGLATFFDPGEENVISSTSAGNPLYRAPETKTTPPLISPKIDIFALGLVLLEMIYPMQSESERIRVFDEAKKGIFPTGTDRLTDNVTELIQELLDEEPEIRPSAAELLDRKYS